MNHFVCIGWRLRLRTLLQEHTNEKAVEQKTWTSFFQVLFAESYGMQYSVVIVVIVTDMGQWSPRCKTTLMGDHPSFETAPLLRPLFRNGLFVFACKWTPAQFGHVTCQAHLSKTILLGTLEDGWHCSWQRKYWMDNLKERTSLSMPEVLTVASCRNHGERISAI